MTNIVMTFLEKKKCLLIWKKKTGIQGTSLVNTDEKLWGFFFPMPDFFFPLITPMSSCGSCTDTNESTHHRSSVHRYWLLVNMINGWNISMKIFIDIVDLHQYLLLAHNDIFKHAPHNGIQHLWCYYFISI